MVIERRTFLISLVLLAALAGLGVFIFLRYVAPRAAPTPVLQTAPVVTGTLSSLVSSSGTLLAQDQLELGFRSNGTVTVIHVRPGDRVTAGQVLMELDSTDQQF